MAFFRPAITRFAWPTLVVSATLLLMTANGVMLRGGNYYDAFVFSSGLFGDKRFVDGLVASYSGRLNLELSLNRLKNADSLPEHWHRYDIVHTGPFLPQNGEQWDLGFSRTADDMSFLGFKVYTLRIDSIMERGAIDVETTYGVSVPWFELALASAIPIWIWFSRIAKRRRRLRRGQCLHCGYDLRASAGICPECGNAIAATLGRVNSHGDP